jgi:hypothetical protein
MFRMFGSLPKTRTPESLMNPFSTRLEIGQSKKRCEKFSLVLVSGLIILQKEHLSDRF